MHARLAFLALALLATPSSALSGTRATAAVAPAANRAAHQDKAAKIDDPEIAEAVDRFQAGDYEAAEKKLSRVLEDAPENAEARLWRARVRFEAATWTGAREDCEAILKQDPKQPDALLMLGELAARKGEYEKAVDLARAALGSALDLTARMRASAWLDAAGDDAGALREAQAAIDAAGGKDPASPRERLALGRALERAERFVDAASEFQAAYRADARLLEARVAWGNLLFRVYQQGSKDTSGEMYTSVKKDNPNYVGALLGLARLGRANFTRDSERAELAMRRVLEIDPANPDALLMRGQSFVDDRRFDDAEAAFDRILAENPRHRVARAERTSLDLLRNRGDAFRAAQEADRKEHPASSLLPRTVGMHLKALYRFADAIPHLEEAATRDARDSVARTALGECLAHQAREKEAITRLQEAEQIESGFQHPWRSNMIVVLEELAKQYVDVDTPNFRVRFHPDDEALLREMLPAFYEQARKFYGERYGYVPPWKTTVEVLRTFDDFSVRTTGFAGFGALGVCFGPLITSVSPLADPFRGNFSYLDTAWHEYSHVVHLGLSNARVPRWFTEGLATLEEKKRNPAFDRNMELELLEARATDTIYPVLELNAAFRGPRIIFGYYQGGLLCEFLEKRSSFTKFRDALELFGKDVPMNEVLERAFGVKGPELDKEFLQFVDERLAKVKVRPVLDERTIARLRARVAGNPKDVEALRSLAWAYVKRGKIPEAEGALEKLRAAAPNDGDGMLVRAELSMLRKRPDLAADQYAKGFAAGAEEFYARMHYAALLEQQRNMDGAKTQLRAAIAAFPRFADPKASPLLRLAAMLAAEEKADESVALIEEFCRIAGNAIPPRLELATRYESRGDQASVARVLGEVLEVDPYRRDAWRRVALAHLALAKFDEAAREARFGRLVKPAREPASASEKPVSDDEDRAQRAELFAIEAEAHLGAKRREEAAKAVKEAQALDSGNERAAKVLERLQEIAK